MAENSNQQIVVGPLNETWKRKIKYFENRYQTLPISHWGEGVVRVQGTQQGTEGGTQAAGVGRVYEARRARKLAGQRGVYAYEVFREEKSIILEIFAFGAIFTTKFVVSSNFNEILSSESELQ